MRCDILMYCRAMKYRRIGFAARARPGRDEWTWTDLPQRRRDFSREFTGSREEAIRAAGQKIGRWLTEHRTQDAERKTPNRRRLERRGICASKGAP
jgi:hypothetical protein